MAFTFLKEKDQMKTGESLFDSESSKVILKILEKARSKENDIDDDYLGLDIEKQSIRHFSDVIKQAKTIVWNGPMGVFEQEQFANGTKELLKAVAVQRKRQSTTIIGGDDITTARAKEKIFPVL